MTLIDTNVLLDLVTNDPNWADWSIAQLEEASLEGPLLINDVVYAELAVLRPRRGSRGVCRGGRLGHGSDATSGSFSGRKGVHAVSQVGGGSRTGVLPDFFIGAHAAVNEVPLLTRDVGRYRTYFPTLKLLTPDA